MSVTASYSWEAIYSNKNIITMSDNKYQFKGTKAPWHAVEYSGFYDIQDAPFYGAKRLMSYDEDVFGTCSSVEEAKCNADLISAAPELLNVCIDAESVFSKMGTLTYEENILLIKIRHAIHKALNITE